MSSHSTFVLCFLLPCTNGLAIPAMNSHQHNAYTPDFYTGLKPPMLFRWWFGQKSNSDRRRWDPDDIRLVSCSQLVHVYLSNVPSLFRSGHE